MAHFLFDLRMVVSILMVLILMVPIALSILRLSELMEGIMSNSTVYEREHSFFLMDNSSIYSLGYRKNFELIFGKNPLMWIFPVHSGAPPHQVLSQQEKAFTLAGPSYVEQTQEIEIPDDTPERPLQREVNGSQSQRPVQRRPVGGYV